MQVDVSIAASTILTMFLIMCSGYIARKAGYIDAHSQKKLTDLVICIGQPCMILSSILSIEYSEEHLHEGVYVLVMSIVIHAISAVVAFLCSRTIKDKQERSITEFAIIFANCGFLGIPMMKALFGDIGGFWAAFYIIGFNIIQWTYGMFVLSKGNSNIKMSPRKILLNFGTIPSLIGILIYVFRIPLPVPITKTFDYVGSICTPMSMIIVGSSVATIPFKKLFTNGRIYLFCFFKLFVLPFVVITIAYFTGIPSEMMILAAIVSSLSSASNSAMFAEKYDIVPSFAGHAVGMVTLLCAATLPVMMLYTQFLLSLR